MSKANLWRSRLSVAVLLLSPLISNAAVVYDSWTSVNAPEPGGNYIVTVNHDLLNEQFDIEFTVDPWNAEGLGLFVDLGNFNISTPVGLTDVSWEPPVASGGVTLFATDTTSDSCGPGCNLNGLNQIIPVPDGQWELVFRLASQGYDGIQTFNFTINDFGLTEADWGLMGVRAQQLCEPGSTLPEGSCGGSDKSYGTITQTEPEPNPAPAPGTLVLIGFGLLGLVWSRKNRASA